MFIFRWIFQTISKIMMGLGIALLIAGFISSKVMDNFYQKAVQTTATIVYFRDNKLLSDDPNVYVRYNVNNKEYVEKLGFYDDTMKVEDTVYIYYNPDVPGNIKYVGAQNPTIIMYILGGIAFAIGAIVGIIRARIHRKIEDRKAEKRVTKKMEKSK